MWRFLGGRLELRRCFLAAGGNETACGAAEEFQCVGDEIGERLGAAAGEGDVDESGYDTDEDTVQDKLRCEAAADPDGEDKTGK